MPVFDLSSSSDSSSEEESGSESSDEQNEVVQQQEQQQLQQQVAGQKSNVAGDGAGGAAKKDTSPARRVTFASDKPQAADDGDGEAGAVGSAVAARNSDDKGKIPNAFVDAGTPGAADSKATTTIADAVEEPRATGAKASYSIIGQASGVHAAETGPLHKRTKLTGTDSTVDNAAGGKSVPDWTALQKKRVGGVIQDESTNRVDGSEPTKPKENEKEEISKDVGFGTMARRWHEEFGYLDDEGRHWTASFTDEMPAVVSENSLGLSAERVAEFRRSAAALSSEQLEAARNAMRSFILQEEPWESSLAMKERDFQSFVAGKDRLPFEDLFPGKGVELQQMCNTKVRLGTQRRGAPFAIGTAPTPADDTESSEDEDELHPKVADRAWKASDSSIRAASLDIVPWEDHVDCGYDRVRVPDPSHTSPQEDSVPQAKKPKLPTLRPGLPSVLPNLKDLVTAPPATEKQGLPMGQPSSSQRGRFADPNAKPSQPTEWLPEIFWSFFDAVESTTGDSIRANIPLHQQLQASGNSRRGGGGGGGNRGARPALDALSVGQKTSASLARGTMDRYSVWLVDHPVNGTPMCLGIAKHRVYSLRFTPPGSVEEILQKFTSDTEVHGQQTLGTLVSTHIGDLEGGTQNDSHSRNKSSRGAAAFSQGPTTLRFTETFVKQQRKEQRQTFAASPGSRASQYFKASWELFTKSTDKDIAWVPVAGRAFRLRSGSKSAKAREAASRPKPWRWRVRYRMVFVSRRGHVDVCVYVCVCVCVCVCACTRVRVAFTCIGCNNNRVG